MNMKMFRIYGSFLLLIFFCLPSFAGTVNCGSGDCTGMLAYWTFEENTGSQSTDILNSLVMGKAAELSGNWTWTTGIAGYAPQWGVGGNTGGQCNDNSLKISGTAITMELWYYPRALTENEVIAGNTPDSNYILRRQLNTNFMHVYLYHLPINYYGVTAVSSGTWHHLAFTYDGANVILYLDGNVDLTSPETEAMTAVGGCTFRVGCYTNSITDEVAVYNTVLTQAQLQDHRNRALAGNHYCPYTTADPAVKERKIIQIINSQ